MRIKPVAFVGRVLPHRFASPIGKIFEPLGPFYMPDVVEAQLATDNQFFEVTVRHQLMPRRMFLYRKRSFERGDLSEVEIRTQVRSRMLGRFVTVAVKAFEILLEEIV